MSKPISKVVQVLMTAVLAAGAYAGMQNLDRVQAALGIAPAAVAEAAPRRGGGAVPVIVAPVRMASDDIGIEVVGTGRAVRSVSLRSEEAGKVTAMALAANARFAAGDMLLQLDDSNQRLSLQLAQARLDEAQRVTERLTQLQGTGAVTAARLEEAMTQAELARLEAERAREALNDRVLRAPFDGVAGLPSIEPGAWIDSNVEIATFDDRATLLVEIALPEGLLARVVAGMPVDASTPAFPGRMFRGSVAAIDSRIDPQSRTARVRIAIPNVDDLLRPGASFTTHLELPGDAYPVIPELAVQFARSGLHVWRAVDGKAEQVPVRLVRRRAGSVLVEGDLAVGDAVVVEGAQRLSPGRALVVAAMPAEGGT